LDNHWHDGWEPEKKQDQSAIREEFSKMPDAVLKMLSNAGNQYALEALERRK
jgi:hypothetical protein